MKGGGAIDRTLGHELFHFIMDNYNNGGTAEHTPATPVSTYGDRLMFPQGVLGATDVDPGECNDMLTNTDETEFVERF